MFVKIESDEAIPYRITASHPTDTPPQPEEIWAQGGQFHIPTETFIRWDRIAAEYESMQDEMHEHLKKIYAEAKAAAPPANYKKILSNHAKWEQGE